MSGGTFGVIEAVGQAWRFVVEERAYIARIALLPVCAQAATTVGLHYLNPVASVIEAFLWHFPATVLFAWLMFAEARFVLGGERLDRLPQDAGYLAARRRAMQVSVLFLLVFNMAVTAAGAWIEWSVRSGLMAESPAASLVAFGLIGLMLWGLRFAVMHILVAAGYPLHGFLIRVRGMGFPLRLLGMGLLCAIPVYFFLMVGLELILPSQVEQMTAAQATFVILLTTPVTMFVPILMNAAAVFALKEMMGRKG